MIRNANVKDKEKILNLLKQVCFVHHLGRPDLFKGKGATKYSDLELENIINNENTPVFVYENEDGEVLGYAFCQIKNYKDDNIFNDFKSLYLDDLCVDENERGKGVGAKLYEFVLDYAKKNGFYNLTLNVWASNKSALAFYEKIGLKPQKICMETILK